MAAFALSLWSHWIKHQKRNSEKGCWSGKTPRYGIRALWCCRTVVGTCWTAKHSSLRQSTWRRDGADKAKNFDIDGLLWTTAKIKDIINGDKMQRDPSRTNGCSRWWLQCSEICISLTRKDTWSHPQPSASGYADGGCCTCLGVNGCASCIFKSHTLLLNKLYLCLFYRIILQGVWLPCNKL